MKHILWSLVILIALSGPAAAVEFKTKVRNIEDGKRVVDLYVRGDDARQRILLLTPKKATAAVILFAGGHGRLKIRKDGTIKRGGNFLVRSRGRFAKQGFVTAVFDVPSDQDTLKHGRGDDWHLKDVAGVIAYLTETTQLPVWLIGTSRGTMTVGFAGAKFTKAIAGVAFTASMDDVSNLDIGDITVPAFVLHHKNDECHVTTPDGAKDIAAGLKKSAKVELVILDGGISRGHECAARSHHGFKGIEDQAVARIATFIRANTK